VHTEHLSSKDPDIAGNPINFESALAIHNGDVAFIESALQVVVDSLKIELDQLKQDCMDQHWDKARVIIHKLEGGTRYFGLERLDQVCETFSKVLQTDPNNRWSEVYNTLLSEVEKVQIAYKAWLKSNKVDKV
jgi:HPt (histidine-containing phosphotransfer) domain-containing protein